MNCLAIFDSGNYAVHICTKLEAQGYVFEVIATPCQIAKYGCGYCLKFPMEYKEIVVNECIKNKVIIREMYKVVPLYSKNKYEKIFPA